MVMSRIMKLLIT